MRSLIVALIFFMLGSCSTSEPVNGYGWVQDNIPTYYPPDVQEDLYYQIEKWYFDARKSGLSDSESSIVAADSLIKEIMLRQIRSR